MRTHRTVHSELELAEGGAVPEPVTKHRKHKHRHGSSSKDKKVGRLEQGGVN